jgi:DnaJ-class molecular chaperone
MDFKKACKNLEISEKNAIDHKELRKQYYCMALKYHPDKYKSDDGERFKKIKESYEYLKTYNKIDIADNTSDYMSILNKFIKLFSPSTNWNSLFMDTTFKGIVKDCENISLNIFNNISKEKSIEVYLFLKKYQPMFHISDELLEQMCEKVHKKMKNDNLIILNPSLDDILNDNIYKLKIGEKTFYVPLWCNEVEFAVSEDQDVIVKCNCELPSNITIDNNNNLIYNYTAKIQDVFNEKSILIDMIKHKLRIPVRELNIRSQQYYLFKNVGMLRVNDDDIYDTSNRGDIIINIELE